MNLIIPAVFPDDDLFAVESVGAAIDALDVAVIAAVTFESMTASTFMSLLILRQRNCEEKGT